MASLSKVRYDYPIGQPDILRPVILHYDGMSFRKCSVAYRGYRATAQSHQALESYEEEEEDELRCLPCMDKVDDFLDIRELPDGKYETDLTIPSVLYKYIIGRQGKTKQMIEKDTKTRIFIPRQGKEGRVTIQAKTKRSLSSAKQRIEVIVWSNRHNEDATHFIGIALHSDDIHEKVSEFRSQILSLQGKCEGIEESVIQLPIKMHLTLSVLRLFSDEEQKQAISTLEKIVEKCKSKLNLQASPLKIVLKGINLMNDDYSSTHVLYAEVKDDSERLQTFSDELLQEMIKQLPDFVKDDQSRVKLHATVMNSRWRNVDVVQEKPSTGRSRPQRTGFDASLIFKNYKDYDFGTCDLKQVLLLKIKEKDDTGFYKCEKMFNLY